MMYGYGDHGWGRGGWIAMFLMMLIFWGAIAAIVIAVVRSTRHHPASEPRHTDALAILQERFARGEIDAAEYHERQAVLRGDQ